MQGQREKFCGMIQLLGVLMVMGGQCVRTKFIEMNTKKTVTIPYDQFSSEIEKGNKVYTLFLVLPDSYQASSPLHVLRVWGDSRRGPSVAWPASVG